MSIYLLYSLSCHTKVLMELSHLVLHYIFIMGEKKEEEEEVGKRNREGGRRRRGRRDGGGGRKMEEKEMKEMEEN